MAQQAQDSWVARVLGVSVATGGDAGALRERLTQAARDAVALKEAGAPELSAISPALAAARVGIDGPDAARLLTTAEELIARATSAMRGRGAAAANRRGIAYPQLLLRWRAAQSQASSAVDELGRSLLGMDEIKRDPRFALAQQAVARLPTLIPELGDGLADMLDQGINAGSDAAIAESALSLVAQYRQKLGAAGGLEKLEAFARKHVGDLAVLATLDGALAEIAANLQRAV